MNRPINTAKIGAATRTIPGYAFVTLLAALMPGIAIAYVGPGAGITMLGSLWGLIVAVVFVIVGILVLPIKLMRNKARKRKEEQAAAGEVDADASADNAEPQDQAN